MYAPYDNLALYVALHADGSVDKKVIGSMTEALKADYQFQDWQRLVEIFRNPTLQMVSFTITEKGYAFNDDDLSRGLKPALVMGKVTALMLERYNAGNCIVDDAVCCEASRKEIVRRYYKCLCEQKITGTAKESERYKLELLMNQAGLTMGAREVEKQAHARSEDISCCSFPF